MGVPVASIWVALTVNSAPVLSGTTVSVDENAIGLYRLVVDLNATDDNVGQVCALSRERNQTKKSLTHGMCASIYLSHRRWSTRS